MTGVAPDRFEAVTAPYRRELLAHCYRMTGSVHDAEDLVQETDLRAWCAFERFEGRSSVSRCRRSRAFSSGREHDCNKRGGRR